MGQSADPKHPRPRHYDEDLKLFLERFRDEALFDYIPGREHSEFHDFEESSNRLKSPVKFARHVAALMFVCWSLTSLCHSNGHIETNVAEKGNGFLAAKRQRCKTAHKR